MSDFLSALHTTDVAPGTAKVVHLEGRPIAICNVDGVFYAIDDICTHDGGSLDQGVLEGDVIECPRHGARFDVKTGRPLCLPAITPIRTYPVRVEGDEIQVAVLNKQTHVA